MSMGTVRYFTFVLVLAAAALPHAVAADPTPAPNGVYSSFESGKPARDAGEIRGEIEDVDYSSGTIVVRLPKGHATIAVLPSTTIYEHDEYATLADLHRGATVDISVSEVGGRLVAQIIHLK
jgi:hypothetical protein